MPSISQITLPNNITYDIKDANVGLDSEYDTQTKTVTLVVGSLENADEQEY